MTWWVAASLKGSQSVEYKAIVDHFMERGIDLTLSMLKLTGATAKVSEQITTLNNALVAQGLFTNVSAISDTSLALM